MGKQATETKSKRGAARKVPPVSTTATPNPTTGIPTTTTTPGAGGTGTSGPGGVVVSGQTTTVTIDNVLGKEGITWGTVESYSVDDERLMIKLVTGAIGRELVAIRADQPHFRSGVSMAMMAFHTPDTKLTVRYFKPDLMTELEYRNVIFALEIGIGRDPSETLAFDDWKSLVP